MSSTFFVGLDVGTTTSKAVVFTESGDAVASGRADTPWRFTATGAELDAHALLASATAALAEALEHCPPGQIAGLGIASLAESGVLLDGHGEPVAPVIAWHDTRDDAELADLRQRFPGQEFSAITGLPLRQQWSLTKHRWLLDHVPAARTAVRRLNVAEWIVRGLGGEEATEQSLASRTGWLRLAERQWWTETLEWSGATESLMPTIVTAGTPLGRVGAEVGLPRLTGAVLTVAGHDHQAAAIGSGADGPGDELDSCGTAEALVRTVSPNLSPVVVAELAEAGITTGWHAVADHWCLLGGTQGGLALQRVLALLGKERADLPALDAAAAALPTPSLRVIAPPFGKVDIVGAGDGDTPAHVWRAALEAVTDQVAVIHDAMSAVSGPHRALVVTGGWSRSEALIDVKRRRFGALRRPDVTEAGARGAALVAAMAAGATATPDFPACV
ncbi:FGGY-family carbohydrate kinase [Rhodococcus opacus]|uniref:FGGY-family carbohydrate kinase n=1 Tax=Rhodococcus opacus TaxID=37919 RepID=UPI001C44C6DC|nr:FGGY family carbohydrate kinase [Rhodococcus opacus]MBV6760210.1 xylulose kinase [Rhodococcus opacus]